ncbi:TetR/AcrR family transcriptional regulator [Gordonia hydrophobica]|uniref:TetR/AcrR family transcriptional regulator n=1 Tax=Gordonia hydrophobica TaxID=40516 RepID=A0ABZ2TZW0_9ACTN|nr:TetR/AcrR family transcriptional regulator [Gordonia hydrophobica]MBM7366392.1 AcrR family transcriptional regulator [Gordonia hydrophobica]
MAPSRTPARDKLIDAASRLFYAHGMAATGIDTVTTEAGVAKMTLYNNFASKQELMDAYIEARHRELLDLYRERMSRADTPAARVLAMFDAYLDHARMPYAEGFRGCGLLNAAAELPAGSAGRDAVRRHKDEIEAILREHLQDAGDDEPATAEADDVAFHLSLLLEGAMSRAGLDGTTAHLERARDLAAVMLAAR